MANSVGGFHPVMVRDHIELTTHYASRKTRRKVWPLLLFVGMCLACCVTVLAIGPNEAELERRTYCQNVQQGIWPDYEGAYASECGGVVSRSLHANLRN